MKANGQVAAGLLIVALATVGCSRKGDTSRTKAQEPQDSAQSKPVATAGASSGFEQKGEEAIGEDARKIAGPVSFADGEAAYRAKKYGDAAQLFGRYTEQRPGNAWGHYMLGLSEWKSGDPAKAEGAFEKALSIDPNHFKSLVNLSRVLIDQKRFDEALVSLTHAEGVEPESVDVQRLLARAYQAQGKTDEAEDAYRRAIALDDRDAWSMNNLGLMFLQENRADEALPLLAKAVELRKDVPAFHNNLGMALEHTGRFGAAATAYGGALTADPGYTKARQNLARVGAVKGERDEEPFDLEATAKLAVKNPKISDDETASAR